MAVQSTDRVKACEKKSAIDQLLIYAISLLTAVLAAFHIGRCETLPLLRWLHAGESWITQPLDDGKLSWRFGQSMETDVSMMAKAESTLAVIEREASKNSIVNEGGLDLLGQAASCLDQDQDGQPSTVVLEMLNAAARELGLEPNESGSGVFREIAPPGATPARSPGPGLNTNRELANRVRLVQDKLRSDAR